MRVLALAAVAALTLGWTGVQAADITYDGSAVIDGIAIDYEIITDGALGYLQSNDVVFASLTLDDPNGPPETDDGVEGLENPDRVLDFTSKAILVNEVAADSATFDGLDYSGNFQFGIVKGGTYYVRTAEKFRYAAGSSVFATAVGTAPDPSTWALMLAGVAVIGAALRFGRRKSGFAAA